jgi:acetaldehyde dehydrogenase/alcohol dehydrogenase
LYCCCCCQVIKNHFASEYIYNKYKDARTCDVVEENALEGIKKIAAPVGVIAGRAAGT